MWIYVNNNLVLGANPNNMAGNTGWVEYNGEIAEPLFDEYGVPMYAYENDVVRERTAEERARDRPVPPKQQPTLEQISEAVNLLLSGVIDDE